MLTQPPWEEPCNARKGDDIQFGKECRLDDQLRFMKPLSLLLAHARVLVRGAHA